MVVTRAIKQFGNKEWGGKDDLLAIEEPLEIRLGYGPEKSRHQKSIAVTMRTPGDDEMLALGFLYSEGIIDSADALISLKHCTDSGTEESTQYV